MRVHRLSVALVCLPLIGADALKIEKTDKVGRKIENEHFIADLSSRMNRGQQEDSGTMRALTYKPFGVTLLRTQNRMHWAPNLSPGGSGATGGYSGLGNLAAGAGVQGRTKGRRIHTPSRRLLSGLPGGQGRSRIPFSGRSAVFSFSLTADS